MPDIDVGTEAIDRPSACPSNWTWIAKENPANASGILEHVQMWWEVAPVTVWVATFQKVNGNTFTTRDWQQLGAVPLGYSEHAITLNVVAGDYIGLYASGGSLSRTLAGDGYWYFAGNKYDCTDQLFSFTANRTISLFAYTIAPPILFTRFVIESIVYTQNCHTVTVVTHTDIECHKYLRFTDKSPIKHPRTLIRRGLIVPYDLRQCFVAYHDIEQEEAGDTLEHTFILQNLEFCHSYYFYFWAKSGGAIMVYTSAIFHFFYPLGTPPFKTCDQNELIGVGTHTCQEWNACSQIFTPTHDHTITDISLCLNQAHTDRRGPFCVKLTKVGGPCWSEILLDYVTGGSPGLPIPDSKIWRIFHGFHQFVFKDTQYRIIVHTLPGWECWNGEEWLPCETFAALQWWVSPPTNPYPRGSQWLGCNFLEGSGTWSEYPDYDATFINWQRCPSPP